jgi:adenosylhomocysteine nucleosidase
MSNIIQNKIKCVITAMDIEFFSITDCLQIKRSQILKTDQQCLFAECAERNVVIAQAGIGAVRAAVCAKELYEHYPCISSFISAGIAGALSNQLNVGDIVKGNSIVDEKQDNIFTISLIEATKEQKSKNRIFEGPVLCTEEFISDSTKRQYFHHKYGALCAEMESSGIARFAQKHNIPFAAIKVISDLADKNALRSLLRMQIFVCKVLADYLLNQGVL